MTAMKARRRLTRKHRTRVPDDLTPDEREFLRLHLALALYPQYAARIIPRIEGLLPTVNHADLVWTQP